MRSGSDFHPRQGERFMDKVYLVRVFYEVYGGMRADKPLLYESESVARQRGEMLARNRDGVLVYAQAADPSRGEYSEPTILAKYGQIPNLQA
jgi:hypothetical protein